MKIAKILSLVLVGMVTQFSMASITDSIYAFRSTSADAYEDGSPVVDGEFYAVVYQKNEIPFAGFNSDCTVVDETGSTLVAAISIAKKSRCPTFILQVDSEFEKKLNGGSYRLYLLDTRASYVNGEYLLAKTTTSGKPEFVRSYTTVNLANTELREVVCNETVRISEVPSLGGISIASSSGGYGEVTITNVVECFITNTINQVVVSHEIQHETITNYLTNVVNQVVTSYETKTEYLTVTNYVDVTNYVEEVVKLPGKIENDAEGIAPSIVCSTSMNYAGVVYDGSTNEIGMAWWYVGKPNKKHISTIQLSIYSLETRKFYSSTMNCEYDENGHYECEVKEKNLEGSIMASGNKIDFIGNMNGVECTSIGALESESMFLLLCEMKK